MYASIYRADPVPDIEKLESFVDTEDGVEAFIAKRADGKFIAFFCDTDAGEVIERRIFIDREDAVAYAARLIRRGQGPHSDRSYYHSLQPNEGD